MNYGSSLLSLLPYETIAHILLFLTTREQCVVSQVCRELLQITRLAIIPKHVVINEQFLQHYQQLPIISNVSHLTIDQNDDLVVEFIREHAHTLKHIAQRDDDLSMIRTVAHTVEDLESYSIECSTHHEEDDIDNEWWDILGDALFQKKLKRLEILGGRISNNDLVTKIAKFERLEELSLNVQVSSRSFNLAFCQSLSHLRKMTLMLTKPENLKIVASIPTLEFLRFGCNICSSQTADDILLPILRIRRLEMIFYVVSLEDVFRINLPSQSLTSIQYLRLYNLGHVPQIPILPNLMTYKLQFYECNDQLVKQEVVKHPSLRKLRVESPQVIEIEHTCSRLMSRLKSLAIVESFTETIPDQFLSNLLNVTKLNLSANNLKHFPNEILMLRNLRVLKLQSNKIKEVPAQIADLSLLELCDLSSNIIETVPSELYRLLLHAEVRVSNPFLKSHILERGFNSDTNKLQAIVSKTLETSDQKNIILFTQPVDRYMLIATIACGRFSWLYLYFILVHQESGKVYKVSQREIIGSMMFPEGFRTSTELDWFC